MKVTLINDQLNAGGAEKVLVSIANLLYKKGVDINVVLYLQPAALDTQIHPSIPVHYLKRKHRFSLKAMRSLKKCVKDCDIVHVHSRYNLRFFMVAKFLTGISKPKIVFQEHVPVLSLKTFTRFCFKRTNAYVAVLKSMCTWAEREQGLTFSKVFYLPNTVSAPVQKIAVQPVGSKIIMVGNFWVFKNQLFAIELLKCLPAHFTLDIYGMVNDKEYYLEIVDLIAAHNLQSRVRLIEGVTDIYTVLGNYNFAIHTSPYETGPLVLLEYMNASLPFLTFNTGDVAANIHNDLPEAIVQSFDVKEWKKRIEDTMMNEEARTAIRTKMKVLVEKYYTEEGYWEKLQAIYKAVLD